MAGPAFVERRFAHWSAHDFGDGGGRRDEKGLRLNLALLLGLPDAVVWIWARLLSNCLPRAEDIDGVPFFFFLVS